MRSYGLLLFLDFIKILIKIYWSENAGDDVGISYSIYGFPLFSGKQ